MTCLYVPVISFFGLIGFLGQWASLPPLDENNNLAFFVIFANVGNRCVVM
jgi:hypothetical protein